MYIELSNKDKTLIPIDNCSDDYTFTGNGGHSISMQLSDSYKEGLSILKKIFQQEGALDKMTLLDENKNVLDTFSNLVLSSMRKNYNNSISNSQKIVTITFIDKK